MDDLTKRLSWAITTHANDDTSRPRTPERNRFCLRSTAMIDARDYIQEHAARIEALERQVKAADALASSGDALALRLRHVVGREYIVERWEARLTEYRATKEGGA